MKHSFRSGGFLEYARGREASTWKTMQEKYANELASASFFKKLKLKWRMQMEFLRRRKEGHEPSAKTLW